MKISAKDFLLIILGIVGTIILSIIFGKKLESFESFSLFDTLIFVIVGMIAIIVVIYKRIGEIDKDINEVKEEHGKLDERLKIHQLLINLEARIINLEEKKNGKKR